MSGQGRKQHDRAGAAERLVATTPPPMPKGYEQHMGAVSVRMGWFLLRHLRLIYAAFRGDAVLAIVLGEIAHHNICRHFSSGRPTPGAGAADWESPTEWEKLEPCSAFSLSTATGIPRETIRRKIATLVKRGWIRRHGRGGYVIRPVVHTVFEPDFNLRMLVDLLDTSDDLRAILDGRGLRGRSPLTAKEAPLHRSSKA